MNNDDLIDIALAFLNSRHLASLPDALADAAAARRWVRGDGFVGVDDDKRSLLPGLQRLAGAPPFEDSDVATSRTARDALLALVDGELKAARALNEVASSLPLRIDLSEDGVLMQHPNRSGIVAIATYAVAVLAEIQRDGRWDRLGRCQNEECGWVYLDRSRNRSKRWCDMRGCGAQAKARAYRARGTTSRSRV